MTTKTQPSGPKLSLFSKGLRHLINDPLPLLESNAATYGDIVAMQPLTHKFFQLNRPDYIKHVLVDNQQNYIKGRALEATKEIVGQGLLTSEGELHRQQRLIMQPAFHRQQVEGYARVMVQLAGARMAGWQPETRLDLHQEMMQLTMAIVAQTLFGADISANQQRLVEALDNLLGGFSFFDATPLGQLLSQLPLPRNRRRTAWLQHLDQAIMAFIQAGRAAPDEAEQNLLSMLLAAHTNGPQIDLGQIRDEVMTMFIAGHETTANAIVWTFYLLAQHPPVEERLHAELDTVLQGRLPTAADMPALKYTRMVLSEALRLYPPAWAVGRRAVADDAIDGYHIPAGSTVLMSQWVMHRHPDYWPEPLTFDPDRFDPDCPPPVKRPRYAYFPFGGGPRACIGERFAWMEGILLIAALAQRFLVRLAPGPTIEPQAGITLRPKEGLPVTLHPRKAD